MLFLPALVLGLVQGLAEFLPISSSAHLILVRWWAGWTDPVLNRLSFDVALHLGTLAALLVVFAADFWRLAFGSKDQRKLGWWLLAATVPGALAGVFWEGWVQQAYHDLPLALPALYGLAAALALGGVLLWAADRWAPSIRPLDQVGPGRALLIGVAQALAIVPGVSRSGITLTVGRALGLDRTSAARFSFLLSAPIIAGGGAKGLVDLVKESAAGAVTSAELWILPVGFIAAAVSGFVCIRFLLKYLTTHSVAVFAWYRLAVAAAILITVAVVR